MRRPRENASAGRLMMGSIVGDLCWTNDFVFVRRALFSRLPLDLNANAELSHLLMRDCRDCGGRASRDGLGTVELTGARSARFNSSSSAIQVGWLSMACAGLSMSGSCC